MIKAVLWDIGGVLLTDPLLADFWKNAKGSKDLRTKFGEGKLSIEEFVSQGSELLGISSEEYRKAYSAIYCAVTKLPDSVSLIDEINISQYILSDTNPIHGEFIKKEYSSLFSKFTKVYLSYEIGMRKNSSAVFDYVVNDIGIKPQEILFIDNKQKLLDYAKELGYQTFLFEDAVSLKEYLSNNNLIN